MLTTERWTLPHPPVSPPKSDDYTARRLELLRVAMGARVAKRRKELGMSQSALGEQVGMVQHNISDMENGKRWPTAEHLIRLSKELGMSLDYLMLGKGR